MIESFAPKAPSRWASLTSLSLSDPLEATLADVTVHRQHSSSKEEERKKKNPAPATVVAAPAVLAERRSLVEVATSGLFDIFGFEVSASASFDPLCEFVNPLLDEDKQLNCGGEERRKKT